MCSSDLLISLVPNVLDLFTVMVHGSELFPGDSFSMVIVGELVSTGMVAAIIGAIQAALRRPTGLVLVSALVMVGMYPDFLGFNQADYSYNLMGLPSAIIGLIILLLRFTSGVWWSRGRGTKRTPRRGSCLVGPVRPDGSGRHLVPGTQFTAGRSDGDHRF